jgi:hypothetical protein
VKKTAKNKTTETELSVREYLNNIADENRRKDCAAITELISKITGLKPKMWGTGIVGYGSYHYIYESGREGDAPLAAFASRANAIVLYVALTPKEKEELLKRFGKHKATGGCIYIQNLQDVDSKILSKMITNSIINNRKKYPS